MLDIIEALSTEQEGLGVAEIARAVGLHKSTAYRLIATLAKRGYLAKAIFIARFISLEKTQLESQKMELLA